MKDNDVCFLKKFPVSMERVQISQPDPQTPSGALIHVPRYLGNLPFRVWKKMQDIVQNTPVILDPNTANPDLVLSVARAEKQREFEETQRKIQKTIQQRKADLKRMRDAVESHKRSAQTAMEDSERIFSELICSIEKRRTEVKQLIRDQERAAVKQAEERLARLELELDELRWKENEVKQLSNTDDHINFLQSCPSVSLSGSTDSFTVSSRPNFDEVVKSVSQLRDKLQQFCTDEIERLSKTVKTVQVIVPVRQFTTRNEFLQYSRLLTVDLNSVNNWLRLLEENTVITSSDTRLPCISTGREQNPLRHQHVTRTAWFC
ncbi:hypothetical protein Q8A67_001308 [Cirrhinus molitorella]|uniref:TRIM8/14/16/25/29/45/65 coiled-coil region domain-containing protein n=1 Tax=Cirrhinus molitorella TaxID=172907 RepID=A0AA88QL19_9TELE|nr:hypothetical protein Q8A67_001308 [Cirrhinus molitorella]